MEKSFFERASQLLSKRGGPKGGGGRGGFWGGGGASGGWVGGEFFGGVFGGGGGGLLVLGGGVFSLGRGFCVFFVFFGVGFSVPFFGGGGGGVFFVVGWWGGGGVFDPSFLFFQVSHSVLSGGFLCFARLVLVKSSFPRDLDFS